MIFTVSRTWSKKVMACLTFTWEGIEFGVDLTPRQVTTMIRELQQVQKETLKK